MPEQPAGYREIFAVREYRHLFAANLLSLIGDQLTAVALAFAVYARSGSPLDTKIEILNSSGQPVPRLLLRCVRDSELEFRGISGDSRGARLKNYEEMFVNDLKSYVVPGVRAAIPPWI